MSSAPPSGPTDLRRLIPTYAARRGHFDVVTVPPLQYLMIDGHGDPNTSQAYADALATHMRFAGDDATRLAAIHRAAASRMLGG